MLALSNFSVIPYLLFAIVLICCFNFIVCRTLLPPARLYKLTKYTSLFLATNGLFLLIIELFFQDKIWLNYLAPFPLIYGPILFFRIKIIKQESLSRREIFLHCTPFILLFFTYILMSIIGEGPNSKTGLTHSYIMYFSLSLSVLFYSYYPFTKTNKALSLIINNQIFLIILLRIMLVLTAVFFINLYFSENNEVVFSPVEMIRTILYIVILLFVSISLSYKIIEVRKLISRKAKKLDLTYNKQTSTEKYNKSSISPDLMEVYKERLINGIDQHQYFLDQKLSLDTLAKKTKIPSHHLTQLLNVRFNQTFYTYINNLRVEHACKLLTQSNKKHTIEKLASACGFNSKVSFNRHFKLIKKCTPSRYLEESVKIGEQKSH